MKTKLTEAEANRQPNELWIFIAFEGSDHPASERSANPKELATVDAPSLENKLACDLRPEPAKTRKLPEAVSGFAARAEAAI